MVDEALQRGGPPAMLIRLSKPRSGREELESGYFRKGGGWSPSMSLPDLADAMRGWWVLSPESVEARGINLAVAVADGRTRAVMEIHAWIGPRRLSTDNKPRWAFMGNLIPAGPIFDHFVGRSGKTVAFPSGSANPIRYWD